MMTFPPDYDWMPDEWCADCGFPSDLCACNDDVAYWEWAEDEWFDSWLFGYEPIKPDTDTMDTSK